jgi:CPA1 family monovalent cation:H+ antiporter
VIIGTVVIQSLTAGSLAVRLGLSSRGEQGVLIVGSNDVALAIGGALHEQGFRVKVADTRRDGLQQARMSGMETYYGSPLSEHAERFMDLTGFTHLMAMSRNPELNAVVCHQFRHEFGPKRVFAVQSGSEEEDDRQGLSKRLRSKLLFPRDTTWTKLASLLSKDGEIRATELTESFDYEAYKAQWGSQAIPLFALDDNGKLRVRVIDSPWEPEPGWVLLSLVQGDAQPVNGK